MTDLLAVRPAEDCRWDCVALGEVMLRLDPGDVLVLPATTRYEIPGGVTETSTERRVIFSPEIASTGSAQNGWIMFVHWSP